MAFTKIRETIHAFKQKSEPIPYISSADRELMKPEDNTQIENRAIDLLMLVGLWFIAVQLAKLAHWIVKPEALAFEKNISTILGVVSAFTIGHFHERILSWIKRHIPEQKIKNALDPYVGTKIRETLHALKKSS